MSEKKLKLSEAIRIGAKLRPQGFGGAFPTNEKGELCSSAIGAMCEAVFGNTNSNYGFSKIYPELWEIIDGKSLLDQIIKMNDRKKLSREEIADYVESFGY